MSKLVCVEIFKVTGALLLKFCFGIKPNSFLVIEVDGLTQMAKTEVLPAGQLPKTRGSNLGLRRVS